MNVLVIATNRPPMAAACVAAFTRGGAPIDHVVVMEDLDELSGQIYDGPAKVDVLTRKAIPGIVGYEAEWIISRGDSAIKSAGFIHAKKLGADVILVLDDDCAPTSETWAADHLRNLSAERLKFRSSVPGYRVRGLPYSSWAEAMAPDVVLSMGLWRGYPDVDAPMMLAQIDAQGAPTSNFRPPPGVRVEGPGFVPLCGMNFAFKSAVLPLLYFPLMGQGQPFGRFDDIFAGLVAKKACDHLGLSWAIGEPHVQHTRASDPLANLVKEAPGIAVNEYLWRLVDSIDLDGSTTPAACAIAIARELQAQGPRFPLEFARPWVANYGRALEAWVGLC